MSSIANRDKYEANTFGVTSMGRNAHGLGKPTTSPPLSDHVANSTAAWLLREPISPIPSSRGISSNATCADLLSRLGSREATFLESTSELHSLDYDIKAYDRSTPPLPELDYGTNPAMAWQPRKPISPIASLQPLPYTALYPRPVSPTSDWRDEAPFPAPVSKLECARNERVSQKKAKEQDLHFFPSDCKLFSHTYEVEIKLADQQADPNSPLYSAKDFTELNLQPELLKGIYMMGFQSPSRIQERALPLLLHNPPRNMIAQSQSGTGKTAAFVLTMLSRIDTTRDVPQALCVCTTRELAGQIIGVVKKMGMYLKGLTTFLACKDSLRDCQIIDSHVIVGTPGTIRDGLLHRRAGGSEYKSGLINPGSIVVLVADEADLLVGNSGLADQFMGIKRKIIQSNPETQIILFSATFPDHVRNFAMKVAPHANLITLRKDELTLDGIKQFWMDCRDEEYKYLVLVEIYHYLTVGQSIIFVKQRRTADVIAERMSNDGHTVTVLHGAQDGANRDHTIEDFRAGRSKVLVTTNVFARGIDIAQVNLVVNYDLPWNTERHVPDAETYLHRIGRTGRFGRKGTSINFVHDRRSFEDMMKIMSELQISEQDLVRVDTKDFEEMGDFLCLEMKK